MAVVQSRTLLVWCLGLAAALCLQAAQPAYGHHPSSGTRARAFVTSSALTAKPGSTQRPLPWSIGDVLIASHIELGFPRIDVLASHDLTHKDSLDLVPACGPQARTRGLAFSPRFGSIKLQLAVSCAPDQDQGQGGRVVVVAAKDPRHPILQTLPVQQAGASVYNRSGTLFITGAQQQQQQQQLQTRTAGGSTAVEAPGSKLASGVNATAVVARQSSTAVSASAASGPATEMRQQHAAVSMSPVVLKRDAAGATAATAATAGAGSKKRHAQRHAADTTAATAAAAVAAGRLEVAAVLPPLLAGSQYVSADLGANGTRLYLATGGNMLTILDAGTGQHLADKPLPAANCTALLAQYDGTLLVACGKCLYHLLANTPATPLKQACLNLTAGFGQHMAMDPAGAHVLVSITDGSLHSIRVSDFKPVRHMSLLGRAIGGVAVLGTVLANQARKPCEQPATCDGVADTCPPNPVMAKGTKCSTGQADNPCAAQGQCDGASGSCRAAQRQTDGNVCSWRPDDDSNVFLDNRVTRIAALPAAIPPSLQHAAVGALRTLVRRRGRRPLADHSINAAHASALLAWGGGSRARPLSVCEGHCADSKCVLQVETKGCCILPGSRLDGDAGKQRHKRRRGTEEDLYCWQ